MTARPFSFYPEQRDRALGVTMLRLSRTFKGGGVDMPDPGGYSGLARTVHSAQCGRAKAVRPARWSRRAMIPSPLLRRAVVAALAALAITWPGMVSDWAQAQPREGFARTSPSGSHLAARHAGDQRDVAAAASY